MPDRNAAPHRTEENEVAKYQLDETALRMIVDALHTKATALGDEASRNAMAPDVYQVLHTAALARRALAQLLVQQIPGAA